MDPCVGPAQVKPPLSNLKDRIASAYYSHGLFCSSHPYSVIFTTLVVLAICCYPLLRLPLLGSSSQQFTVPVDGYVAPVVNNDINNDDYSFTPPRWYVGPPVGYVQQVIVKIALSPWKADLILTDAFRGPLAETFRIREFINNHQSFQQLDRTVTLNDACFQVSEPIDKFAAKFLPHFQCLVTSPTNIWNHNQDSFQKDPDLIKAVFSLRDSTADSSSLREVLFGVPWKETGIKQFNVRSRPRVLTYGFTIVLQTYDREFIQSLIVKLESNYPSRRYAKNVTYSPSQGDFTHVYFQDLHAFAEFIPLGVAYTILFLYIYFSVRKIDLVKSKWALAISAVMTVMMSLFMSVGLCVWFGLNPTLNGSEILPYLIVVIGLENMLVLTKSVVSTPVHLDVKLRVAQGLSKEGWSITKNLFTELALLTIAFLTFVPKIQEFCLFAVVGLFTDFFLQLVFFATFLSIDIRRMEISDLHRSQYRKAFIEREKAHNNVLRDTPDNTFKKLKPISPNPSVKSPVNVSNGPAKVFAPTSSPIIGELPKRMKFIYFWARTRMVQRGLMICLVMWIVFWAYNSSIMEKFSEGTYGVSTIYEWVGLPNSSMGKTLSEDNPNMSDPLEHDSRNIWSRLEHRNLFLWQSLSPQHWITLFGYYNISLSGRYISILPPIHLSHAVTSTQAEALRTPADVETSRKSHWQFLSSIEKGDKDVDDPLTSEISYHPSSPAEAGLAIALAIPTLLLFTYFMIVLYRCMCTRHYAEWRSSWKNSNQSSTESRRGSMSLLGPEEYLITETLPIKLQAHTQEVENIECDERVVVSGCLYGNICVWDALSGDCLVSIMRSRCKRRHQPLRNAGKDYCSSFSSDSTYSSSPLSDETDHYLMYVPSTPPAERSGIEPLSPVIGDFNAKHPPYDGNNAKKQWNPTKNNQYDFSMYVKPVVDRTPVGDDTFPSAQQNETVHNNSASDDQGTSKQTLFCSPLTFQAIWCLDFYDSFIAVGCKEGRLEIWNAFTGNLEYVYEDHKHGITSISFTENRLVAARVNGIMDFFSIEILQDDFNNCQCKDHNPKQVERSHSSIRCSCLQSIKAHTLSISALEIDNCFVVSGGFDRLVKVFKCDSATNVYTLHGHSSPISALHIDKYVAASAVSGCANGLICLWDLMTGACMYSLNGHHGEVTTIKLSPIYMISQGTDNRICIWEKCQGHLLHSISQDYNLQSNFVLLTCNIMVTAKEDNLLLWDINHGEALRMIMVGNGDHSCHIRQLRLSGQSVICDYGAQMFIVNFPALTDKLD